MTLTNKPALSHQDELHAGQAVYTPRTLKFYDFMVLGVSNHLIWHCATRQLLRFYRHNMRGEHLEIGVGSGFFPSHAEQPAPQRLVLTDLNTEALSYASRRIARPSRSYQRNVLEPLDLPEAAFDSVSMSYLLHCVPGNLRDKACAFDHASAYLKRGGVLFGSTLLQSAHRPTLAARALMRLYNLTGIFHNQDDRLIDLEQALSQRFRCYQIQVVGHVAMFWALKT